MTIGVSRSGTKIHVCVQAGHWVVRLPYRERPLDSRLELCHCRRRLIPQETTEEAFVGASFHRVSQPADQRSLDAVDNMRRRVPARDTLT